MPDVVLPVLSVEDAMAQVIAWLRNPYRDLHAVRREPIARSFDILDIINAALDREVDKLRAQTRNEGMTSYRHDLTRNTGPFHTAVWDLVRRGIARPRAFQRSAQSASTLRLENSLFTEYGHRWLEALSGKEAIPMEYGRFAEVLTEHASRFGSGFHTRSQEAVKRYQAQAYLACAAMCGAAAESILLSVAVARTGDEQKVLSLYRGSGGRRRVEQLVGGQLVKRTQEALAAFTDLLKFWRDSAAHGGAASVDEEQAFPSMVLLLRFAHFAEREWEILTGAEAGR